MPVVLENSSAAFPSDLLGRPAAWHALYLAALAVTVALLAVLLGGGARIRTLQGAFVGTLARAGPLRPRDPRAAHERWRVLLGAAVLLWAVCGAEPVRRRRAGRLPGLS
jgi:hypothetical protein